MACQPDIPAVKYPLLFMQREAVAMHTPLSAPAVSQFFSAEVGPAHAAPEESAGCPCRSTSLAPSTRRNAPLARLSRRWQTVQRRTRPLRGERPHHRAFAAGRGGTAAEYRRVPSPPSHGADHSCSRCGRTATSTRSAAPAAGGHRWSTVSIGVRAWCTGQTHGPLRHHEHLATPAVSVDPLPGTRLSLCRARDSLDGT
jgi:hypothetical protein